MNRRHFFAVSLPALLGWAASGASAQDKPAPKVVARRIEIQVSLLKPSLKLGDTNARMIIVVTDEEVETYASFLQMYTYQTKGDTSISEAFGPFLRITPHIEADGKITLNAKVQFEESTPGAVAVPNMPLPTVTQSMTISQTVESGQVVMLGGLVSGSAQERIQLKATVLKSHQREPNSTLKSAITERE